MIHCYLIDANFYNFIDYTKIGSIGLITSTKYSRPLIIEQMRERESKEKPKCLSTFFYENSPTFKGSILFF